MFSEEVMRRERAKSLAELKTLLQMVRNWKDSYYSQAVEGGGYGWDFLCKDLAFEIEDYLYPYVQRMKDCKFLSDKETNNFMNEAYGVIDELRVALHKLEEERRKEEKKRKSLINRLGRWVLARLNLEVKGS